VKIKIIPVVDRTLQALIDRFHERADALGIAHDEAMREALRSWLEHTGVETDERVLEATESELAALKAVLAAMRSYNAPPPRA
jgi:hypothetical protein